VLLRALARGLDGPRGLCLGELGIIFEWVIPLSLFLGFKIMSIAFARLPDLAIPNTTKPSNVIEQEAIDDAVAILLIAPAALDANVYTIEGRRHGATTFVTLQEGSIGTALADVKPPAAGKSFSYDMREFAFNAFSAFRIVSDTNVTDALHVWECIKLWEGTG